MKKTLLFALAAVATIFTSCSSDIINDNDDSNNNQGKGMTLIANVEQPDTRATLDTKETFGTWSFAYTDNDKVKVGNNTIDNYYTFTKSGENFSCADAKATSTDANWYAYYPSTTIDLTNQEGTEASAAQLYALAGATETATTGANGLTINMKAQAAVLRIVKVDNYGPCDIHIETTGGYVKGLKAKKNEAGYEVETSTEKVSVFKKESNGNAGIYYVIVPAGVPLKVYNDGKNFKTTSKGLSAGKYYTLTSGPTTGTATATINGEPKPIGWVQLWIGGPRFATEDVANMMTWNEDVKKGENYVWGSLWRTPSASDVSLLTGDYTKILTATYTNTNGIHGFTFKGEQPGYKTNELYLRGKDTSTESYIESVYLLSDKDNINNNATTLEFLGYSGGVAFIQISQNNSAESKHHLRPILSQETVLWGKQNIQ